ncbi:hypothetical protein J2S40_000501 [Nocardioides luteus]|nr:hypothetical protein [Nocardioides luteus]
MSFNAWVQDHYDLDIETDRIEAQLDAIQPIQAAS